MIKILRGTSLVRNHSFFVATGKAILQEKCYVTFLHNLHLSGFNFFFRKHDNKTNRFVHIFAFSFLVRIYF